MSPCDQLGQREIQVATMVWEGKTNPEIAAVRGSTGQVVKNQLHGIFDKLGVWSRLELALYVASHGGRSWATTELPAVKAEAATQSVAARIAQGSRLAAALGGNAFHMPAQEFLSFGRYTGETHP